MPALGKPDYSCAIYEITFYGSSGFHPLRYTITYVLIVLVSRLLQPLADSTGPGRWRGLGGMSPSSRAISLLGVSYYPRPYTLQVAHVPTSTGQILRVAVACGCIKRPGGPLLAT